MHETLAARLRIWDVLFGWKRRREAAATLRHAKTLFTPGTTVLDVGCGMGYALEVLGEQYQAITFGCDVVPSTHRIQRFCRFDGEHLPFADNSIDVAVLIFVLHHAEDPLVVLKEASRVARKAVLVVEDTPRTLFDRRWGEIHIRRFNKRHNIPWQGNGRTEAEWEKLFAVAGMPLLSEGRLTRFERLPPVARTAFVLEPAAVEAKLRLGTAARKRLGTAAPIS